MLCCFVVFCSHKWKPYTEVYNNNNKWNAWSIQWPPPISGSRSKRENSKTKSSSISSFSWWSRASKWVLWQPHISSDRITHGIQNHRIAESENSRIPELRNHRIAESQNHRINPRMAEVVRNLWTSSCPNPLLSQVYLELIAQAGDSTISLVKLFHCSVTLKVKFFHTLRSVKQTQSLLWDKLPFKSQKVPHRHDSSYLDSPLAAKSVTSLCQRRHSRYTHPDIWS